MQLKVNALNVLDSSNVPVIYNQVTECPCCKATLVPKNLYNIVTRDLSESNRFVFISTEYCSNCHKVFISKYKLSNYTSEQHQDFIKPIDRINGSKLCEALTVISCEPNYYKEETFEEVLATLSPQFVKIYNQSLAAESSNLDEIAGIGYRKALEFLIKDFAIHITPDDEEKIKSMKLSGCIKNYISDPIIKTLAERSVWLGNDETHYVRKHTSLDIDDMKRFIKATVYFISMNLIAEEAASIPPDR